MRNLVIFFLFTQVLFALTPNVPLMSKIPVKPALASPDMNPSDGDAWTENDNATYTWTEVYNNPLSWSTDSQEGTYSLNATHTESETKMYVDLALPSSEDASSYDYLSFWLNASHEEAFYLYIYNVSSSNSYRASIIPRTQWDLYVIRLKSFTIIGSTSWSDIKIIRFYWYGLTANGNETFLLDNLHFATYNQSAATNSIGEAILPRFAYFMHNQTWAATGGYPDSLYAFKRTDTEAQSNSLECEVLGQSIFLYCWAYNISGFNFYLDMAEAWANALLNYQNTTEGTNGYGGFAYGRSTPGQRMLVNAWTHLGLIYLYHFTGNSTIKTALDRNKIWLVDTMWNDTNDFFNHHYEPSTDTFTYGTTLSWHRDGVAAGAISAYTRYVEANATLTSIADNVFSQMITLSKYRIMFSVSTTEYSTYGYWGIYEGYMATTNASYRNAFLNSSHSLMLANLKNPTHNGSITASMAKYRIDDESEQGLAGWGHMIALLQIAKAYDLTLDSNWCNLLSKMLWDYVYEAQTSDGSITFFRNARGAEEDYNYRQYTPTSACVVAAIWWYYRNIAEPSTASDTYIIDGTEKITSISHTNRTLSFTVSAGSQKTSTTRIYTGSKGEPKSVKGASSWSYADRILTIYVVHSSDQQVEVKWATATAGRYILNVYVRSGSIPLSGANVTIGDITKRTNLFGIATFELPYGHYEVTVAYGVDKKTKQVLLKQDKSIVVDLHIK